MLYPIGIQNFESLRSDGYVYVDKTALVYKLAAEGRHYFLSRPRRFGKSLLISTMEAYFSGRRNLFDGLAISELEKDWNNHPILHLDLNTGKYDTPESLEDVLNDTLSNWEAEYGASATESRPELRFKGIIRRAYEKTGLRVVVLVDEYDKPMLQAMEDRGLQETFRNTLKAFYSVLKTQDLYIRFAFLTGVTKFGKVSVFSDLNNLKDISMDPRYVDICGISEEELHRYFDDSIQDLADSLGISFDEACAKLKERYDGYHFREDSLGIYNPFSLLNALDTKVLKDYWFETGTPSFLIQLLKSNDYRLEDLTGEHRSADVLSSMDSIETDPIPVIYQSGYLTITGYDPDLEEYTLGFPNREVEAGFTRCLLPFYVPANGGKAEPMVKNFVRDVRAGNPESFMEGVRMLFEGGDYAVQGDKEMYFQNTLWTIFRLMGFYTEVERRTARGRMDVVIKTDDYIYVMELKLDGSANDALRQIDEKGYAEPFRNDRRKLFKIGVNFSSKTSGVESWKIEQPCGEARGRGGCGGATRGE